MLARGFFGRNRVGHFVPGLEPVRVTSPGPSFDSGGPGRFMMRAPIQNNSLISAAPVRPTAAANHNRSRKSSPRRYCSTVNHHSLDP
jgi:hypothetical protein